MFRAFGNLMKPSHSSLKYYKSSSRYQHVSYFSSPCLCPEFSQISRSVFFVLVLHQVQLRLWNGKRVSADASFSQASIWKAKHKAKNPKKRTMTVTATTITISFPRFCSELWRNSRATVLEREVSTAFHAFMKKKNSVFGQFRINGHIAREKVKQPLLRFHWKNYPYEDAHLLIKASWGKIKC